MIFFCEDCGEKNDLGGAELKNGRAVFRCCSCGYLNSYPVPEDLNPADILLKEIQNHPEIVSVFLYHEKNRTVSNPIPEILTQTDVEMLGAYLIQSCLVVHSHYSDIHEAIITISDKHITIQRIDLDLFVFIISTTLPLSEEIKELLISMRKKEDLNAFS